MIEAFKKARNAGTPLFGVTCYDPAATMEQIQKAQTEETAIIQWDLIEGWRNRNKAGLAAIEKVLVETGADLLSTINPTENLKLAERLPEGTILFVLNAHHFLEKPDYLQAMWNLRDIFKTKLCSIVMLGPDFSLPSQVQNDVFLIDEPLPTEEELRNLIVTTVTGAGLAEEVWKNDVELAVDALRGLAAFPAEQSVAMNLSKRGLDVDGLWERKRRLISSTPGLRVYEGKEIFTDLGGCDQIKRFMKGVINGKESPNVIVFIDEGEKMFAGATGDAADSSGVSQDFLGTTLSYMEDNECDGAIFVGPPGAAKSAIAKATGNEAGVPTVVFDFGGMKGGLVGKSEAQVRAAFKIITSVGGGKAFFIMTCNRIVSLPPELRRRFTSGIFFFDLPTYEERQKIWSIYKDKYQIDIVQDAVPVTWDEGWTGAEIRNCCRMAYRQNISLSEAAKYIVPVAKAAPQQIQELRRQASGAYLSANEEGIYTYEDPRDQSIEGRGRKLNLVE